MIGHVTRSLDERGERRDAVADKVCGFVENGEVEQREVGIHVVHHHLEQKAVQSLHVIWGGGSMWYTITWNNKQFNHYM